MIDRREKQASIRPRNKHVKVMVSAVNESKTEEGVILKEDLFENVIFEGIKTYTVEILEKAKDCKGEIPEDGYAIIDQLSGLGVRTVEPGYIKLVNENMILMTSKEREFKLGGITPHTGRALVKVTSKTEETESGLLIADSSNDTINWEAPTLGGVVICVAPDITDVAVGDVIRWDPVMGVPVWIGGEEYRIVLEKEIVATIDKDEA